MQFLVGYCQEQTIFGIIYREESSRGQLSGGQFSLGAIIWGVMFLRDNCPDKVKNVRKKDNLPLHQKALLIMDVFGGRMTQTVLGTLQKEDILL